MHDTAHSAKEKRFKALGKTNKGRLLFISFTIRKNKIRVISPRDQDREERGSVLSFAGGNEGRDVSVDERAGSEREFQHDGEHACSSRDYGVTLGGWRGSECHEDGARE